MTRQYLAGELSVRLERLQAVTPASRAAQVARLRDQVESCPLAWLATAAGRALALADGLCWDSLSRGVAGSFERQACVSADLRQFGICSRLLEENPSPGGAADGGDGRLGQPA
jgi:hypothetical protein